jgi:hypothetical protein
MIVDELYMNIFGHVDKNINILVEYQLNIRIFVI